MTEKPKIALITDLDVNEGIGKYGQYLYEFLVAQKIGDPTDYLYLDFSNRTLVRNPGNEREVIARTDSLLADNKPFFWMRIKKKIPDYDLYHIVSQNLSFLLTDKPFIITVHDLAPLFIPTSIIQKWGRMYLYSGIRKAIKIISISHSTKNDLIRVYKIPADKIKVTHEGVNHKVFYPRERNLCRNKLSLPTDKKIILNVAIEKWRKNIPNLVRAFALVSQKVPNVIMVRIGKKTEEIANLISQLKIEDKVLYFSNIPTEEELAVFYNAADLFVFPSYYEGFGLPPLEAMACGIPAIVSDRTSLPEIALDQTMLVNPDNPEVIANKILELLTHESFYREISLKAFRHAQEFTWEKMGEQTYEVYSEILRSL